MFTILSLSALALRPALNHTCAVLQLSMADGAVSKVTEFLSRRFLDHSMRLTEALRWANRRSWQALEISLGGDSLWKSALHAFAAAEHKAFRDQLRAYLDSQATIHLDGTIEKLGPDFRKACLKEIKKARKAGLFDGMLDMRELAAQTAHFARFSNPRAVLDAEWQTIQHVADSLQPAAEYASLRQLLAMRPDNGDSILAVAVRYFFRRQVQEDEELFREIVLTNMEAQEQASAQAFEGLNQALADHGGEIEKSLDAIYEIVEDTHDKVLDLREEQKHQGKQLGEMYDAVLKLQEKLDLSAREVRPRDSMSIRTDAERQMVRLLLDRFRQLPAAQQRQSPALLNGLGQLQVAAGEFGPARQLFEEVAGTVAAPEARAEAYHNAYRAALEKRDWPAALEALGRAVSLDKGRYAPFPFEKYEPKAILGAGGFGTAFLCTHRKLHSSVVVKSLYATELARDVDEVFAEASVLDALSHPSIIRVRDCDFADEGRSRPFFVMEYFDGTNLEEYVLARKPIAPDRIGELARPLAEAIAAAHSKGVLHRDIKPRNVLVRDGEGGVLQVKLIDFGLAMKQDAVRHQSLTSKTLLGSSVAGTQEYAAPEQMGKLEGVSVGPYSDVFGFGRTLCYALFKTTTPLPKHWKTLPDALVDLLAGCLAEDPAERPQTFAAVLGQLGAAAPTPRSAETRRDTPPVAAAPRLHAIGEGRFHWHGSYQDALDVAVRAIARVGFTLGTVNPAAGLVTANAGLSLRSFGENVTVSLRAAGAGVIEMLIESKLKVGAALGSWGKNKENVDRLGVAMTEVAGLPVTTPTPSPLAPMTQSMGGMTQTMGGGGMSQSMGRAGHVAPPPLPSKHSVEPARGGPPPLPPMRRK